MNNDELQKAIDDITNNNAAAEAAPAVDATAENEQLASELAGAAATEAAAPAEFAPAPAPAPEVPAEPGMPPVAAAEVAPEMAEAVAPAVEAAPVAEEVAAAPEIKLGNAPAAEAPASDNATLEEAYKELYPLLDKVELPVEEKFEITLKFGEPSEALELAKQIAEPTAKANALLKIVNKLK